MSLLTFMQTAKDISVLVVADIRALPPNDFPELNTICRTHGTKFI